MRAGRPKAPRGLHLKKKKKNTKKNETNRVVGSALVEVKWKRAGGLAKYRRKTN